MIKMRKLQEIKRDARIVTAGLIQTALDSGTTVDSLMEHYGMSEPYAKLVERELAQLAKHLVE